MPWLLAATAWASGTVIPLGAAGDPAIVGNAQLVPPEAISPEARWTLLDEHAMRNLGEELLGVRALMYQFDGELEIMSRLEGATSAVRVIRNEEERRLLYQALAFEGFAVQRYFQDELATDPAAEPYRVTVGGRVEIKAWVDAVALDPYREPTRLDISEEPELTRFKEARDRLLYLTRAGIRLADAPVGAKLILDGTPADAPVDGAIAVQPGRHLVAVLHGGAIIARADVRIAPGETWTLTVPPPRLQLDTLASTLQGRPNAVELPLELAGALSSLPAPVRIAVPGEHGPVMYEVDGGRVVRMPEPERHDTDPHVLPVDVRTWVGVAWLHDESWYRLNLDRGAPDAFSTTNAAAPALGIAATYPVRMGWVAGGGVDLAAPTGEWHRLPVAGDDVRLRAHPYVSVGPTALQATVGLMFPWHVGVGARFCLPLLYGTELTGGVIQGAGTFRERTDTDGYPSNPRALYVGLSSAIGP